MALADRSVARVVGPVCGIGRGPAVARCADRTTPQGSQRAAQCKGTGIRIKPGAGWGYGSPVPCPEQCMIAPPSASRMPRGPDIGGCRQAGRNPGWRSAWVDPDPASGQGAAQVAPGLWISFAFRRTGVQQTRVRRPPAADCSHRQQKNRTTEPEKRNYGSSRPDPAVPFPRRSDRPCWRL